MKYYRPDPWACFSGWTILSGSSRPRESSAVQGAPIFLQPPTSRSSQRFPAPKTVWFWDPPNSGVLLLARATATTLRQVYAGRGGRALNTNLGATCQLTAVPNSAYTGYPRPPEWHTPYWVCVLWESTSAKYCTSFQTVMHIKWIQQNTYIKVWGSFFKSVEEDA